MRRLGSLLKSYRAVREVVPWRVRVWSVWVAWQLWRSHPDWQDYGPTMASVTIFESQAVREALLEHSA